jgi:hypothetical protein
LKEFKKTKTNAEEELSSLHQKKEKLEKKTQEQETYIKKQLVSQTAATFAKKKEQKSAAE